jgi:thioredoxin reductase
MNNVVDIIIIGGGIAGLYAAYQIKRIAPPNTTILVLEKNQKQWLGGRAGNETFYGANIVVGAGVGRKGKDRALIKLLKDTKTRTSEFTSSRSYVPRALFQPDDIMKTMQRLKHEYNKRPEHYRHSQKTFKQFFIDTLGEDEYRSFVISAGYTDFEDADIYETLYNYGMDDNVSGWTAIHVPWKDLIESLYQKIGGSKHFRFSTEVTRIHKIEFNPGSGSGSGPGCIFEVSTSTPGSNKAYYANKVVVATTVDAVRKIVPGASSRASVYQQIQGQPFLIVYAKFDRESTEIMKKYVTSFTVLQTGHLQKMIPMDPDKGVYMIAYSDNHHARTLKAKGALENTRKNCEMYSKWAADALGIPPSTPIHIIAIKDYYWSIGTHYYTPLNKEFKTRTEFIRNAQHPEKGMVVVGEMVSRDQGWVEGALESVDAVITREWVSTLY